MRKSIMVTFEGFELDVAPMLGRHPGGDHLLRRVEGTDVTAVVNGYHPPRVLQRIRRMCSVEATPDLDSGFLGLVSVEPDYSGWFRVLWRRMATITAIWCLAAVAMSFDWPVTGGVLLALAWQQAAFLGHDAGHSSISGDRNTDRVIGLWVTCVFGVTGSWWRHNHNVHHVLTNQVEHDPDIQHMPFLAVDPALARGYFSTFYDKWVRPTWLSRLLIPMQQLTFLPIMCFARLNMYWMSFAHLRVTEGVMRWAELACLAVYWAGLWSMWSLSSSGLVTMLVAHALIGILHLQITLSHFAMPVISDGATRGWVRDQFETTLDIIEGPWVGGSDWATAAFDWFHGGLQFQLEHHLMPRLPRDQLRGATDNVHKLSNALGVEAKVATFGEAMWRTIVNLGW